MVKIRVKAWNTAKNYLIMLNKFKTNSKRAVKKTDRGNGNLIGNKIAGRILKVSKTSQNNSETITNEHDKETPKERYISPEERENYW